MVEKRKRQKRKPRIDQQQVLETLRAAKLQAVVRGTAAWLAVSPAVQTSLDQAAFGVVDGGPGTALETRHLLEQAELPQEDAARNMESPAESNGGSGGAVSVRLSLEEALYMSWMLEALQVCSAAGGAGVCALSPEGLWSLAVASSPDFPYRYAGYHHFRAKGFLPRCGLQYGADLVIYRRHPSECHSDACVRLVAMASGEPLRMPSWHDLSASARLCAQVSKGLLVLFVNDPVSGGHESITCLQGFQVQETTFARWQATSSCNRMH
mmetsp:Transcript_37140/g.88294  ORF Transcript_37140/g.88294 Transcript_37140/m.88294 type:complete len:267 (+) Transcript_37140:202-1002(+)